MRYFLIFILLLVFSGNFAQQVSYSPMEISLPPSVRITSIAHDNLGMIWVGTSKGLFSYDGEELIKHSEIVNEQPVLGFAESDEGKLLAFGKFGILQIHNQGNSVEIFSVVDDSGRPSPTDLVALYVSSMGIIWGGSPSAAFKLTNRGFEKFDLTINPTRKKIFFSELGDDNLTIIGDDGSIHIYDEKKNIFTHSAIDHEVKEINTVITLSKNEVFIAGDGLFHLVYNDIEDFRIFPLEDNLEEKIQSLLIHHDQVFASTAGKGLYHAKMGDTPLDFSKVMDDHNPNQPEHLPLDTIMFLHQDVGGEIWLVSERQVGLLHENFFTTTSGFMPHFRISMMADREDESIWVGARGVYQVGRKGGQLTGGPVRINIKGEVASLTNRNDTLIVGDTDGYLYMIDEDRIVNVVDFSHRGLNLFYLYSDNNSNIWVCQAPGKTPLKGIAAVSRENETSFYGPEHGLESRVIVVKESPSGELFFGGGGDKTYLYRFDAENEKFINLSLPLPFFPRSHFEVHDLAVDEKGTIWLATTDGLVQFGRDSITRVELWEDFIPYEVTSINIGENGNIWLATDNRGIVNYDPENSTFVPFDESSGLVSNQVNYRNLMFDKSGFLWVGTNEGLAMSAVKNPEPGPTLSPTILNVNVNGDSFSLNRSLVINDRQKFDVQFKTFAYPVNSLIYEYRLLRETPTEPNKIQTIWTRVTDPSKLQIEGLNTGRYKLEIRARRKGGHQWSNSLIFPFRVNNIWYNSAYAYGAYFIVFFLLLIFVVRYRMSFLEARKALKASEIKYRELVENATDVVFRFDYMGNITFINSISLELSGYKSEEVVGQHFAFLIGDHHKESVVEFYKEQFLSNQERSYLEFPLKKRDGNIEWLGVNVRLLYEDDHHKISNVIAVGRVISDKIAAEKKIKLQNLQLQEKNARLSKAENKLLKVNTSLAELNSDLKQLNAELEERGEMLEEKRLDVEMKNSALRKIKKELELKAKELDQASRYKSQFLANMSHELRTPLNSILLLSKLLGENKEENLSGDQLKFARVIHDSGKGLLALINDILDLSKIEAGKLVMKAEDVSLQEMCERMNNIFEPLAVAKNIDYQFIMEFDEGNIIKTDQLRVEQILKNLLSNALKFTEHGEVSFKVLKSEMDHEYVSEFLKRDKTIAFEVKDSGIGIASDKLQAVFEAFQQEDGTIQRKYEGTGLGLAISRKLAVNMGGEISLHSEPGKGSTFTLFLPFDCSEPLDRMSKMDMMEERVNSQQQGDVEADQYVVNAIPFEVPDDRDNINSDDQVILIVEDDPGFALAIMEYCHSQNYKAIVAPTGDMAYHYAEKYKPIGVFLDIKLPVKSGLMVLDELKNHEETSSIPVLFVSSVQMSKKDLIARGAIDFIEKQYDTNPIKIAFEKLEKITKIKTRKLLLVGEQPDHLSGLYEFLDYPAWECLRANSALEALSILERDEVQLMVLDLSISDGYVLPLLQQVSREFNDQILPVILYAEAYLNSELDHKIDELNQIMVIQKANSYRDIMDYVRFFLHVPVRDFDENKALITSSGQKILLVDNDVRNIFSLTKILEDLQLKVYIADNTQDGLVHLNKKADIGLVIIELSLMGEAEGFYERINELKKWRNLQVIACSENMCSIDKQQLMDQGITGCLPKPVDADKLPYLLNVWLNENNIKS